MKGRAFHYGFLTHAEKWQGFLLTIVTLFVLLARTSHADILPPVATAQEELDKQRISQVTDYVRTQALHGVSLLPSNVRSTLGWFSGSWRAVHMAAADDDTSAPAVDNADAHDSEMNLVSNYHHKGFLPTHDAMMMGASFGQNLVSNKLDLAERPFIGQSWDSLRNYWGAEMTLDVAKKADGLPWGKISLGYIGGNDALVDHGTGVDLHGDIDLTEGWKFTTGVRQDSSTGDSNYMMFRWKINFD